MADEQNQEQGVTEQQAAPEARFQLQKLYVKDVSFEVPNAPQVFQEPGQAEVKLNLSQRVNNITEGIYEVVLTVTVTATADEKTAYLAEIHQAGLFGIAGLEEAQLQGALNTLCPHTLFPYASRSITDLVASGGFPPLVLQPVNFEQIYMQRLSQAQGTEGMEVQGNA
ncbi:MAG: protein-export chaperone SecB [Xanthomonadales bacterium]|nr:protein-export chaperone SecB [Xanthomonadales bacterium]NIX11852.1 protein-export chaperone SecB [Xanthomonadales bacterium]